MEKYKVGKVLGDGTFGSVTKAVNTVTGQVVAIKKMKNKYTRWEDCIGLQQIKSLARFHHPNIVNLYQVIKHDNELYFVFEYMEQNIYQMMKGRKSPLSQVTIRNIIYQTLQGLAYMHRHGYFHRDMKPQNLLECDGIVKIADFGLAREIRAKPPFTQYVSTRWYRAPQIILRSTNYNSPVDIFAVGAIMAELYNLWPLFPGQSQKDQIFKICQVMGTPAKEDWPDGYKLAGTLGILFPSHSPQKLANVIPSASPAAIKLISAMLSYNPQKRPSAINALQDAYFQVTVPIAQQVILARSSEDKSEDKTTEGIKNARYRPGVVCKLFDE